MIGLTETTALQKERLFGVCFDRSHQRIQQRAPWNVRTCVQSLTLACSATPDGLNPLNRSQKLSVSSKIAMGESNHDRFTTLVKSGKM